MISDLRLAVRQLVKSPGFTLVAVLTLALGIGANTAIFSVINAALLRPLTYPAPQQLVEAWSILPSGFHFAAISGPQAKMLRDDATHFSSMAIYRTLDMNLIERGHAERVTGPAATAPFLATLGIAPQLGRSFEPTEDDLGGNNHVVLLTHEWWQSRFGGDPALLNRVIDLNEIPHTVVGILPPRALFDDSARFIVPLVLEAEPRRMAPDLPWARTLLRLKPGVTIVDAEEEARALSAELHRRLLPDRPEVRQLHVRPLQDLLTEKTRPTLLLLLGAVILVLIVACSNVANLLLARATARQKEMAIRTALGASNLQIKRQVLTESVLLALLGGLAGIVLAAFGADLLGRAVLNVLPDMMQPTMSGSVLLFSVCLACGTGLIFGLFPAFRARQVNLQCDLKDTGRGSTSSARNRAQSMLIVGEIAVTAMLLIGAGLLLRSFVQAFHADPGFNPKNVLLCDIAMSEPSFANEAEVVNYHRAVVRAVEALPGVVTVATSSSLPLSNEGWGGRISLTKVGHTDSHGGGGGIDYVNENYFAAMGIPLLRGRNFTAHDNTLEAPRTAIVNQFLLDALIGDEDPIGLQVRIDEKDWEIIGVVGAIRHSRLDSLAGPRVYLPHARSPSHLRLTIRTSVAPLSLESAVRAALAAVDSAQSVSNFRTLEDAMGRSLGERRVALALIGVFAAIAVLLACLGIYGVMAYTIGQRQRELSIRMALGAQRRDVIRLVALDGLRLGLLGIVVGVVGAFAGARLIANHLYEVSATDPLVFSAVVVVITGVTALGIALPARRASNIDAIDALRAE